MIRRYFAECPGHASSVRSGSTELRRERTSLGPFTLTGIQPIFHSSPFTTRKGEEKTQRREVCATTWRTAGSRGDERQTGEKYINTGGEGGKKTLFFALSNPNGFSEQIFKRHLFHDILSTGGKQNQRFAQGRRANGTS